MKHNDSFFIYRLLFTINTTLLSGCTNIDDLLTDGNYKVWIMDDFRHSYLFFDKRHHQTDVLGSYNEKDTYLCTPIPSYMINGKRIITYFDYPKNNYKFMLDTLDILYIKKNRFVGMPKNTRGWVSYTTDFDVEYNDTTIRQKIYEDVAGRLREKYKTKMTRIYFSESGIKEYPDENAQVVCYLNKLMQHGNNEYLFCWCYITEREGNAKGQRKERKSCVRFEYTLDNKGALAFRKEKSYRI